MATNRRAMSERRRDDETGRFSDKYPREDVIEAIRELSGTAATSEVADYLEADRNTVYKKLRIMEDRDEITSRKAGGIRVWSVANDE